MAAAHVPMALTTEPLFSGDDKMLPGALPPMQFLARMNTLRLQHGLNDVHAIIRTSSNFRGSADLWWTNTCEVRLSGIDQARIKGDWAYFESQFQQRFFAVTSEADTVLDITDCQQSNSESTAAYLDKAIAATKQPIHMLLSHTVRIFDAGHNPFVDFVPAGPFKTWLDSVGAAGAADLCPLTGIETAAVMAASMNATKTATANLAYDHVQYDTIVRQLARGLRDTRLRAFVKERMFNCDRQFPVIMEALLAKERALGAVPRTAPAVSALEHEEATDDSADEDAEDVDAVRSGKTAKKGAKKNAKGKANKGRPDHAAFRAKRDAFRCRFCQVNSHETVKCFTLCQHLKENNFEGPDAVLARRDKKPWENKKPWEKKKPAAEPMDTSAADPRVDRLELAMVEVSQFLRGLQNSGNE